MKRTIWLLRAFLAIPAAILIGRMAFYFVRTAREAIAYSAFAYYDPTVFVVLGLLLLPAAVLGLRYGVRLVRRMGRPR